MSGRQVKRGDLRLFKVTSSLLRKTEATNSHQTDISLEPTNTQRERAPQWLHEQPADSHLSTSKKLVSLFPGSPHSSDDQLDFIVADAEGMMLYSVFQTHLTDFLSVLEFTEGLGDADYQYKREITKSVYRADVS